MRSNEIKKFNFEKYELAKLKNPKIVYGGTGAEDPNEPKTSVTGNPLKTVTTVADITTTA